LDVRKWQPESCRTGVSGEPIYVAVGSISGNTELGSKRLRRRCGASVRTISRVGRTCAAIRWRPGLKCLLSVARKLITRGGSCSIVAAVLHRRDHPRRLVEHSTRQRTEPSPALDRRDHSSATTGIPSAPWPPP